MRRSLAFAALVLVGAVPAGDRVARADEAPAPAPPSSGPPWLGISMDAGTDVGVRVEHVVRGAPAERAGLRVGDRIVTVGGTKVTLAAHVTREVTARKVGDRLELEVERQGTPLTVAVVLAMRPAPDAVLKMDLVGAPAPAFARVTPLTGAPSALSDLRGRVVLLDFWASFCGPCKLIAPRLSALRDKLGPQGLAVIGVTTDEPERAAVAAERFKMRYPVVVDGVADTSKAYGITSLPTLVLVDKSGVVRDVFVGFDPGGEARLESVVRGLLAEPAPPPPSARPSVRPAPPAPR